MVGGGNFCEYQNIVDWAKDKDNKSVVYGCSQLVTPCEMIGQLSKLGGSGGVAGGGGGGK